MTRAVPWTILGLFLSLPSAAFAQLASNGPIPGVPAPSDMRTMGAALGRGFPASLEPPITKECGKDLGCVVVMNTSDNFDVVALYLGRLSLDGEEWLWSDNQLRGRGLRPHKAMFLARAGDDSLCDVRVRVVLRNHRTKEEVRARLGSVSLCKSDGTQNIVLPIKVLQPQVILEDAGE